MKTNIKLVNKRYKLMKFAHKGMISTHLYDFINDLLELANVYEKEDYKDDWDDESLAW